MSEEEGSINSFRCMVGKKRYQRFNSRLMKKVEEQFH